MTPPAALPETSEKAFQGAFLEFVHAYGWRTAHFHDSRRQIKPGVFVGDTASAGFPDVVAVRRDRVVFVELKREKGRTSQAQKEWIASLTEAGQEVYTLRPRDWSLIERTFR